MPHMRQIPARLAGLPSHVVRHAHRRQLRGDLELAQDRLHLGAHGGLRDDAGGGDLAHRAAVHQLGEHLPLPRREGLEPATLVLVVQGVRAPGAEQPLELVGRHDRQALVQAADRGQGVLQRPGLGQHLARTAAHAAAPPGPVDRRGHHDHVGARPGQGGDQRGAVTEAAQVEVEQDDARVDAQRCRAQRRQGAALLGHRQAPDVVALQREGDLEGLGEQRVVLDDEDAAVRDLVGTGSLTSVALPCGGLPG